MTLSTVANNLMSLRCIMDAQKERLRHKICSAILEIWRKETGSVLPLSIEGTICVTPSPGRTTAFQLSAQIPAKFPLADENSDEPSDFALKRRRINENGDYVVNGDCAADVGDRGTFKQNKMSGTVCDSNNNHSEIVNAEHEQVSSGKQEQPSAGSGEEEEEEEEESDHDMEPSDMQLPVVNGDLSVILEGDNKQTQESVAVDNNDSGIQDVMNAETSGIENSPKSSESQEVQDVVAEPVVGKENDNTSPPPLAVDLSCRESTQPVLSFMYNSPNVQTALRSMLSNKIVATPICKLSGANSNGDFLRVSPMVTVNNATQLILQRHINPTTVKPEELVKISTPQALTFAKHSTPVSLVYPIGGKPFVPKPLQSILSIAAASTSGSISAGSSSPMVEAAVKVPIQAVSVATVPNVTVKSEPGVEQPTVGTEQKTYRCEYCNKTFLFKSKYQEHLPVHTTERPYECQMCQRTYKYKYDLNVHQRTHQGIPTKSTICPKCNQRFPTNKLLRVHISDVHKDEDAIGQVKPLQPLDGNLYSSSTVTEDKSPEVQDV